MALTRAVGAEDGCEGSALRAAFWAVPQAGQTLCHVGAAPLGLGLSSSQMAAGRGPEGGSRALNTGSPPYHKQDPRCFPHLREVSVCPGKVPEGQKHREAESSWCCPLGSEILGIWGSDLWVWACCRQHSSYPGRIPAAHTILGLCRRQGDSGLASSPGAPGQWPLALVSVAFLPAMLATGPSCHLVSPSFWAFSLTHQSPRVGIRRRDEARTGQGRLDLSCRAGLLMSRPLHTVDH